MQRVKVNWFQQEIDTNERNWNYIKNQGHLLKFLYNRYEWYNYPRLSKVSKFPLHVDIEVSARCDMACPMCPRRHVDISEYDHMEFDLFKRIVDECYDNKLYSARLSWRGESLTHPDFLKFVHYIKCIKHIPNVSFLTNGHKMTEEIAKGLVDYGLDYVSFSVDGIGEIYSKIRAPAKFESVYQGIVTLKTIRDSLKKRRPQIRVAGLWPAIAQNPDEYFKKIGKVADKIVSNPIKNYNTSKAEFVSDYVCQFPWQRLFIGFNGLVQPCSNSIERLYIGSLTKNTITEVWHGKEMENLRKAHLNKNTINYFACSKCSYKVKTDYIGQFKKDWKNWNPEVYKKK